MAQIKNTVFVFDQVKIQTMAEASYSSGSEEEENSRNNYRKEDLNNEFNTSSWNNRDSPSEESENNSHFPSTFDLIYENFEKLVENRSLSGHSTFHTIKTRSFGEIVFKFYLERGLLFSNHLYLSFQLIQPSDHLLTMTVEVKASIATVNGTGPRIREATCKCSTSKASYLTLGTVYSILREADLPNGVLKIRVQLHLFCD